MQIAQILAHNVLPVNDIKTRSILLFLHYVQMRIFQANAIFTFAHCWIKMVPRAIR
jgi:hypothetical protein